MVDGAFVEVEGTFRASDNVLLAISVKALDAVVGQPSGSKVEVEGYIDRVRTAGASFELIGPDGLQAVTWTAGTTFFEGGTGADLHAGLKIEVEGIRKPDGSLAATKIEIRRASNIEIKSEVTAVASTPLTIFGKTVTVNALTQYEDESSVGKKTFGKTDIEVGDTLEISAYLDESVTPAAIVATRVERIDPIAIDRHVLQGPVESFLSGGPDLTILGITVLGGGASFLDADESPLTQSQFFQVLADEAAAGRTTVVKARGTASNPMSANELQIEPTGGD